MSSQTVGQEFTSPVNKLTQGYPKKIASIPGSGSNLASALPGMTPIEKMNIRATLVDPDVPMLPTKNK